MNRPWPGGPATPRARRRRAESDAGEDRGTQLSVGRVPVEVAGLGCDGRRSGLEHGQYGDAARDGMQAQGQGALGAVEGTQVIVGPTRVSLEVGRGVRPEPWPGDGWGRRSPVHRPRRRAGTRGWQPQRPGSGTGPGRGRGSGCGACASSQGKTRRAPRQGPDAHRYGRSKSAGWPRGQDQWTIGRQSLHVSGRRPWQVPTSNDRGLVSWSSR